MRTKLNDALVLLFIASSTLLLACRDSHQGQISYSPPRAIYSNRKLNISATNQNDDHNSSAGKLQILSSAHSIGPPEETSHMLAERSLIRRRSTNICDPRPAVYGLRSDEHADLIRGALVLKANEPTDMYLIGSHLDASISVALTPTEGLQNDDCTHTDRVKSMQVRNLSSNIAIISVDLPSPGLKVPYFLCLRDSLDKSRWFHQGNEPWLTIYIKQDFLPLYAKLIVIMSLLMLSGLFSGLNLGLMALDKNELQVIISCGSETEKRYARAIEPVRRRGNYLLCSILFANVLVNSTIAVLLEELTSGIVAVITSTVFIVMFGEILPQSFCSRHGLAVGAKTVLLTYFCMIVTFPLSYPVSYCLDWALGEEIGHAYDRERLMEFIRVTRDYNKLEMDEVNIISGALKLKRIHLSEVMTRIDDVFMLDVNACLDFDTIQAIIERGYSRIPVHEPGDKKNIVALLFAKDLALLDPDDRTPVKTMISFHKHPIMYLFEDMTLDYALNEFKTGKSHMAFVRRVIDDGDRDPIYEITGIVTLEDVIEEIMQVEINDETDTLTDNRRKRRRKEAQVRKDFSQFTNLGAGDSSHNIISPQLCLAAYQYLATAVEPFSCKFISDNVLKRLLSQKIYYKVRMEDSETERRLYTADKPSDHFIMILEGRVHVKCGQEEISFDAGPFSFFGLAALKEAGSVNQSQRLESLAAPLDGQQAVVRKESAYRTPIFAALERRESTVNKTLASSQLSASSRKLEQLSVEQLDTQSGSISGSCVLRESESRVSVHSAGLFLPDYTVDVIAASSYLKVTRAEYLTALKATFAERDGDQHNPEDDTQTRDEPIGNNQRNAPKS